MLTIDQINPTTYNVLSDNSILGLIYREQSGMYVFSPDASITFWSAESLHTVADTLDQLNVM